VVIWINFGNPGWWYWLCNKTSWSIDVY